jgi:hypothetical protein
LFILAKQFLRTRSKCKKISWRTTDPSNGKSPLERFCSGELKWSCVVCFKWYFYNSSDHYSIHYKNKTKNNFTFTTYTRTDSIIIDGYILLHTRVLNNIRQHDVRYVTCVPQCRW